MKPLYRKGLWIRFRNTVNYQWTIFKHQWPIRIASSLSPPHSIPSKQNWIKFTRKRKREKDRYTERKSFQFSVRDFFHSRCFEKNCDLIFFFLIDIWLFNNINEDEKEPQRSIHRHIHLFKSTFLKKQNIKCNFIFIVIPTCSYIFIWVFNKFFNAYIFV